MTRSEIIDLANQLTERKAERVVNLQSLYRFVVQDIAKRQRFWWRRVEFLFTISANTRTYDLTAINTTPSLTEIAVEEITKFSIVTATNPLTFAELTPIFDSQSLIEMIANTTQVQPGRYTMDANDWKTVRVDLPDMNYTAYVVGWGMPNPASDTTNDAVPLIPMWGHNTIVEGLKAYIFEFAYGAENPKAIKAMERYESSLQDLMAKRQFDPNYRLQLSLAEDAVRST